MRSSRYYHEIDVEKSYIRVGSGDLKLTLLAGKYLCRRNLAGKFMLSYHILG